jgi:hypothetical protein
MGVVKDKIRLEIDAIEDESLLHWVLSVLRERHSVSGQLSLSPMQKQIVLKTREDYKNGHFYTTDELFAELENEAPGSLV